MDSFVVGAQLLLAAVLAVAGVAKLFDLAGSRRAVADFGVPAGLAPTAGVALPIAEIVTAVALVLRPSARWGGVAALVLMVAFVAGVANALARGRDVDCGCFGRVYSATASSATLARNAALGALAAVIVVHGPGPAINTWVDARTPAELVAISVSVAAAALAIALGLLWSRHRKVKQDLADALSNQHEHAATEEIPTEGLVAGTAAPEFALEASDGQTVTLKALLAAGKPLVLTFLTPTCGPCNALLPELARWQATLSDRLTFAVITTGTPTSNPTPWEEFGMTHVLYDDSQATFDSYQLLGTPKAVLVATDGRIAAGPAGGLHMPEVLVRMALRGVPTPSAPAHDAALTPTHLHVHQVAPRPA